MPSLEQAISIAASAHAGYRTENDEPYILHPLRVMLGLHDEDERIVAVLHDVVEKTGWTLDNLRNEGFSEQIIAAVDAVTRRHNEDYFDFVQRMRNNDLGRRVKIMDLKDNIAKVRNDRRSSQAEEKLAKYEDALVRLQ
ncbi:HD domain-containing protein [Phyllobacterium sp. CL33Tsu]|uniref:HD domain-containing protein n=1 Tax=Phyllobacterium sp. CL33Tsu TaxID=1798191 RepID=UPI0008E83315|nr:HD domain-containing protein [Phyllobacterium sp. CL33Tsu]SFI78125.1 HD domain-containing protein [Phyllobacterium sp. CL33Tsu]